MVKSFNNLPFNNFANNILMKVGVLIMIDLLKGSTFEEYLEQLKLNYGDEQLKIYNSTKLSSNTKKSLQGLTSTVNVAIFSEGHCPDCMVTLPFIKRMAEENINIKLYVFPRTGHEAFLEKYTGDARIPTIMTFDKAMNPKRAYVEFPKELLHQMSSLNLEGKKSVTNEYRQGEYNSLIEEELLEIVL